jgi:hypothetical protein
MENSKSNQITCSLLLGKKFIEVRTTHYLLLNISDVSVSCHLIVVTKSSFHTTVHVAENDLGCVLLKNVTIFRL